MLKLSDTDLSREAREVVESGMKPGEELVRVETPQVPFLVNITGGNVGYVVAIVILAFMGLMLWQGEQDPTNLTILATIAMAALGIQLRMQALRRGAHYLLTTQRAIICKQGFLGGVKLRAFFLHPRMTEDVQQDRHGRGHLVFDYTDYAVNGEHLPIGFLWLRDVNATLEVLNSLLKTISPEQAIEHEAEEEHRQQNRERELKRMAGIILFGFGAFSIILGGVNVAVKLLQDAPTRQWIGSLLLTIVGLILTGGGITALRSRR